MTNNSDSIVEKYSAGILRRLGALFYDLFLIVPLLMLVTFITILPLGGAPQTDIVRHMLFIILLLAAASFYCWFWTHGGQTLGMRAWRLKLVAHDGSPVPFAAAAVRCLTGGPLLLLFAFGYIWILLDPERLALHDRLSKTRVVVIKKENRTKK